MSSNLISFCLLSLTLIQRSTEDDSKLKYSICKDTDFEIDSGIRLMDTNYVYLIANNTVFNLQIKSIGEAMIDFQHSLNDWSDSIQAPIDLIRTDDRSVETKKHIQLVNCDLKKEWTLKWDENIYKAYKSTKTYDCRGAFEFLFGPMYKVQPRAEAFSLLYIPDSNDIKEIEVRFGSSQHLLRRLNETGSEYHIKLADEWETDILKYTIPFTKLLDRTITAGFILDVRWYLFAGKHFCSFEFDLNGFQECKIIAIKDWISNCNKELDDNERDNNKKSGLSVMVIILVIIIVIAFIVILVIVVVIVREIFKKKDISSARISSSGSGRRLRKKSVSSLISATTLATTATEEDINIHEKKTPVEMEKTRGLENSKDFTKRSDSGSDCISGLKTTLAEDQKKASETDIRSTI